MTTTPSPWRTLDVFRTMSNEDLDELEQMLDLQVFGPGQVLMHQGDPGDEMFLLDQGRVQVVVSQEEGPGFQVLVDAPAVIGEMALVTHAPRSATVTAVEEARCLRLMRDQFERMVAKNPMVAVFLTEAVGQRLLETDSITSVGKYRIVRRIGSGGAATVFEAIQPDLAQPVAVKMLSHSLVMHPGFAEQFKREAKMAAGLRHDHVVQVLDTEHAYGTHFIIMERLNGNLLEDLIAERGRLRPTMARQVLIEVLSALEFAHGQGLLHRDIKPSNVFFTSDRRAKILDFGIAVQVDEASNPDGQRLGTPYYMSPEQILRRSMDGRSDLYQVGVMAYEMVTGKVPYDSDDLKTLLLKHLKSPVPDPRTIQADVPEDLAHFIMRAMAKHPDDRFTSCGRAADYLRIAQELPLVRKLDLTSVSIQFHPVRREKVERALAELEERLSGMEGITLTRADLRTPDWQGLP